MITWAQEAAEAAAAAGDVQAHRWLGYQQGKQEANADREREMLSLVGALLDIEHEAVTSADGGDVASTIIARIESVLGPPPREWAAKMVGESAVRASTEDQAK